MVKYTREQRLRAVRLYERYGRSAVAVIDELGYPSGQTLAVWHRLWVRAGRDDGESLGDRCLCSIRDCGFSHVKVSGLVMGACRPLLQGLV